MKLKKRVCDFCGKKVSLHKKKCERDFRLRLCAHCILEFTRMCEMNWRIIATKYAGDLDNIYRRFCK